MKQFLIKAFDWLRRFMRGRYGPDELSLALFLFSCVFTFLSSFRPLWFLRFVTWAIIAVALWRVLSRNVDARSKERTVFLRLMQRPLAWSRDMANRFRDRKTHCYFKCKNCGASLRVPKGKGKIKVTCPKCGTKTQKKT